MPSIDDLEAAYRTAEGELLACAKALGDIHPADWTLVERGRLHQLREIERRAWAALRDALGAAADDGTGGALD